MRTTLTLDDDVAARLKGEAQRSGRSFRDVVNDAIREGLAARRAPRPREPFRVVTRDLGETLPGVDLDDVEGLLERIEGPDHR